MTTANHHLKGVDVAITNLTKIYETRDGNELRALDPINIRIMAGQFVAIVGPSGCGKSTLLSLIAGISPRTSGSIQIDGEEVRRPHLKVGVVFQTDLLLYWRTVVDNILLPIEIKRWDRKDYMARVDGLLAQVGLAGFGEKFPNELSGGMRQRVAICRALVREPGLLLMDEPFGALDALTPEQMITDLQMMWLNVSNTVIFITHSIEEAVFLADTVLVMSPRPGRIDLDLHIELDRPRSWKNRLEPKFAAYVSRIHEIFEARGVLTKP
jgi:NitT/TauT family transport system ATP-binding protein